MDMLYQMSQIWWMRNSVKQLVARFSYFLITVEKWIQNLLIIESVFSCQNKQVLASFQKFPFKRYSWNRLKSVKRMTAALSFLVIHTKWMKTCIFRSKMDPVLPRNYSSPCTKTLMIESCFMSFTQLRLQNTTILLTLMCLSVHFIFSNS